jgi:hypothetical protein
VAQRDVKCRLELGLVEAWERTPGSGRFKLCHRQPHLLVGLAVGVAGLVVAQQAGVEVIFERYVQFVDTTFGQFLFWPDDDVVMFVHKLNFLDFQASFFGAQRLQSDLLRGNGEILRMQRDVVGVLIANYLKANTYGDYIDNNQKRFSIK